MKNLSFSVILLSIFIYACGNKHQATHSKTTSELSHSDEEHEHGHDHDEHHDHKNMGEHDEGHDSEHEEIMQLFTAYSTNYELFAEMPAFVVGETVSILAHFTHLENFKPLSGGKVTVSLIVGTKTIQQTLDKPIKKGIYRFSLIATESGSGKLIFDIDNGQQPGQISLPNMHVFEDDHAAHQHHEEEASATNAILFTKEQSWKLDFGTALPSPRALGNSIKTTAVISAAPSSETTLVASTNGIVTMPKALATGSEIHSGSVLFSISGDGLAENNSSIRYQEASNNFELARSRYKRQQALADENIVSKKDLEQTESEYKNAEANFRNLQKHFKVDGQQVVSEKTGYISELFAKNGSYVETGTPLARIANNTDLLLSADIAPKYYADLKNITQVYINASHLDIAINMNELNGQVISIGQSTNAQNYLLPVSFQIENNGTFFPGQIVELAIETDRGLSGITVPNTSLLEEQGAFFVLVQITPELFEKRLIRIGASNGVQTAVISGLKSHERIITKGALMVKLSQASSTLDPHAGHVH